jgi:hypothetical protein
LARVADFLSELLPVSGAPNASMIRNRTMGVGEAVVTAACHDNGEADTVAAEPVVVGLNGGYVRSRHRQDERN